MGVLVSDIGKPIGIALGEVKIEIEKARAILISRMAWRLFIIIQGQ
jgi:hypothetical protein